MLLLWAWLNEDYSRSYKNTQYQSAVPSKIVAKPFSKAVNDLILSFDYLIWNLWRTVTQNWVNTSTAAMENSNKKYVCSSRDSQSSRWTQSAALMILLACSLSKIVCCPRDSENRWDRSRRFIGRMSREIVKWGDSSNRLSNCWRVDKDNWKNTGED